jgi:hypothetical protein
LNDPGKKNTTTTTSDSSKSKDKAKGKPISTVAIVMIVLGAVACLLIIAVVIWALRRRNKNKLMREPISFDPQPTTRFEIESDCDNSADYHGAEVTPYIPSPRTSMAMAQASRDPMSYGMHYSSANPFADQNPFDPSPYGVASTYSQPTAYPYSRGGIASTTRDPTRLPALSVVTGAEPDMVRRDRAFNPFENPLPPLPADKQPKYHTTAGATSQQAVLGFVPVRSGSVRSDSSNTTRRSSIDRPFGPLSAVNEEAEVEDMYQPHMAGIPEHEPYGNARW